MSRGERFDRKGRKLGKRSGGENVVVFQERSNEELEPKEEAMSREGGDTRRAEAENNSLTGEYMRG